MADKLYKMQGKRVFAAIDIPAEVRASATQYVAGLKQAFPSFRVRWENPEKYHVTLRFEAAAGPDVLAEIEQLVESAAESTPPFELTVSGTGAFKNRRGPSVLWLGLGRAAGPDPLQELAKYLSPGRVGKFSPHLTIARIKDAEAAAPLIDHHLRQAFRSQTFTVTELRIYESTLSSTGSTYSVLLRRELRGR